MKIGIVGKGKMGLDIFSYFLEQDCEQVLIVRRQDEIELLSSKFVKQFERMKKRGVIDEEKFDQKLNSFEIHTSYEKLADCDLVIETVVEDLAVKQDIMKEIEENVSMECMIVSNSSSLDLDSIFDKCKNKKRCMGLHFFFPVKYIEYVEINCANCTDSFYAEKLQNCVKSLGKKVLFLDKQENYLLSKMITLIVSYSYLLYSEGILTIEQVDQLVKNNFMMFGPFEMMDSTGLVIINQCTESFLTSRYYDMIKNIGDEVKRAMIHDYFGGQSGKGFILFEKEQKEKNKLFFTDEREKISNEYLDRLKAMVCNEIAYLYNKCGIDGLQCMEAVEEILGFHKKIKDMYFEIRSNIHDLLLSDYKKYGLPCMEEETYILFENIENEEYK